jgi:hypothetical protein
LKQTGSVWAFALIVLCALLSAWPAMAEERIDRFASDIGIAPDGTLTVQETIAVTSEGRKIQHGITRDFPTIYRDAYGNRKVVGFDVSSVTRDGAPEGYAIENIANGKRVRIGRAETVLAPGPHVYVITYTTDRQIGFFPDFDELYWNVTGFWPFAIGTAEAVVHTPAGARITGFDFYTGPQGAQGKNAVATPLAADSVRFRSAPLAPGEGMTIAVRFPKGVVTPPGTVERAGGFLRQNAAVIAAAAGLLALLVYYLFAWWHFGRDPARGVIVPLFAPPKDFSAPAVRFVHRMGFDRKTFAAAIVGLAVKRYLTIAEEHASYTLTRTGKTETEANLAPAETAVAQALFKSGRTLALKQANHQRVAAAIAGLHKALRREDEGVYFVTNRAWFWGGLAILVASAGLVALLSDAPEASTFLLVWLSAWSAATAYLIYNTLAAWQRFLTGYGSRIGNFFAAVASTLFTTPFMVALIVASAFLSQSLPLFAVLALLIQGGLAVVFYRLLKAPTVAGGKIRDQIDGFHMFLETAERDRLEILHPPEVTPEIFEKYLPYAIALDAENAWSRKFAEAAARAGEDPARRSYSPSWYSGGGFDARHSGGFASSLGSALTTATAAAASAPGSHSGSGGGGSSGGGGGGGGGGGW